MNKAVDRSTWNLIDAVNDADKGAWPVAGGTLDQSHSFLAARRIITSEINREKAKQTT